MASTVAKPIHIFLLVLSFIGIILWTAGLFIGSFFFTGGSWGISLPLAVAVGALMAFMLYLMRRYTDPYASTATMPDQKRFRILYGVIYGVLALGSAWFVMHSVAVTTSIRTQQKQAALEDLAQLYNVVNPNGSRGSYTEYINEEVRRFHDANTDMDPTTLSMKEAQLSNLLLQSEGFNKVSNDITDYWQTADATVRNWDLLNLPSQAGIFAERKDEWFLRLNTASSAANVAPYSATHIAYECKFTPRADLNAAFTKLSGKDFSVASIAVMLVLQLLILGVWLAMLSGGKTQGTVKLHDEIPTVWNH